MNRGTLFSRYCQVLSPFTSRCRSVMWAKENFGISIASAKGTNNRLLMPNALTAALPAARPFKKLRLFITIPSPFLSLVRDLEHAEHLLV